jgi:hypothetical protein
MFLFWMILRAWMFLFAFIRSPVAVAAGIVAAKILALWQRWAIYHLEVVSGQPCRADRRPGFFRRADDDVSAAGRVSGSVARPPPRAGLRRAELPRAGLWRAELPRAGLWRAGLWRAGLWRAGLWRAGLWRAGLWRAGLWRDRACNFGLDRQQLTEAFPFESPPRFVLHDRDGIYGDAFRERVT